MAKRGKGRPSCRWRRLDERVGEDAGKAPKLKATTTRVSESASSWKLENAA
jgi:hypothetical protein